MTVLTRVNQLTKTIKNMGRFRYILGVFAKHGFADLLKRSGLGGFIPVQSIRRDIHEGEGAYGRLRMAFEELGPAYIKLGQVMATRGDLLPMELVEEMKKLQDKVPPFEYEKVIETIEADFKYPWNELFTSIDEKPLAAASIAQVHKATTKNGDDVVIKVQRPNVAKEVRTDIEILTFFAKWLVETVPESRIFSPVSVIREFARSLKEETSFFIEANNIRRMRQNLKDFPKVRIPKVYTELSTVRVLTLERFDGFRIDKVDEIEKLGISRKEIVLAGMDAFLHMVLVDGLFHCDLHAGNVMILKDGSIGLLDFGIVGRLSQRVRDQIVHLFLALFTENYENLAFSYVELAPSTAGHINMEVFQKDLIDTLSPVYGMNIKELDVGRVLMDASGVAYRHHLELPRDLILLFRALVTVQGMCRDLHEEFDIVEAASKHFKTVLNVRYSKDRIFNDFLLVARDTFDLVQMLPKQLRLLIRRMHHNQIGFQHTFPQLEEVKKSFSQHSLYRTYLFVGCFFLFIGQIKLDTTMGYQLLDISIFVWIPWVVALGFFALAFKSWLKIGQKKKQDH